MTDIMTPVTFKLASITPDARQYKPSAPVLFPADLVLVAVDVPTTKEYFKNCEKLLEAPLGGLQVAPVLTPKGLRYVVDQFEISMGDSASINTSAEFDWEGDKENTEEQEKPKDDDWDFDESEDKNEKWEEKDEDWE